MARLMKSKKGILLTLGMLFISLTILFFANLITKNSENSEERIKEFAETERIYNLEHSISKSFSDFLASHAQQLYNISVFYGNITYHTNFSNNPFRYQGLMEDHQDIFIDRLSNHSAVQYNNVTADRPLFSHSKLFLNASLYMLHSSRFYPFHPKDVYIEYITYPFNAIYLSGFTPNNTAAINVTLNTSFYPLSIDNVGPACTGSECINLSISIHGQNPLAGAVLLRSLDIPINISMLSIETLVKINLSTNVPGLNYTVAFNWFNLTGLVGPPPPLDIINETGLYMMAPIASYWSPGTDGAVENAYNFPLTSHSGPEEDLLITLQVFMRPESNMSKTKGLLRSPRGLNINYPFLDTTLSNYSVYYRT